MAMSTARMSSYGTPRPLAHPRTKSAATLHQDVISHHISVKDLIDADILQPGDQVWFKEQTGTLQPSGNISFKGVEFTSLSKWAKHVASALGLTKHYNGWKVALHKTTQRPMGQFRDKFYAEHAGLPYTFPPMESKKRKKPTARVSIESTRKPRTAGILALSRVSNLPKSRSVSDDSESNTSSHNGEEQELDEWQMPAPRVSLRKRNLRMKELCAALDGSDVLTDSEEEEWYDTSRGEGMIGEVESTPCGEAGCYVCENLSPSFATHFPTWADILQLALFSLSQIRSNDKLFFSLGEEIYPFIDRHWYKLCSKPRNSSWRQTAKMTLAHSRYAELFENGYDQLLKTGYWRLKNANREAIEQLSAGVASSGRGTPHASPSSGAPGSSPKMHDPLKFSVTAPSFNGVHRNGVGPHSGDEQMSLLASLAAAEGSSAAEDLNALSSLSSLGAAPSKRSDHHHHKLESSMEEFDEYSSQHASDRRRAMANQFRSPSGPVSMSSAIEPIHQLRKEYQLLDAKYKTLEQEHRTTLMQLEAVQSLLLASRRQDETTRLSYAQQAELQEGQVRLLLEKVQRLEFELYQRNAAAGSSSVPSNSNTSLNPLMASASVGNPAALSAMMGVSGLPKLGLLNQNNSVAAAAAAAFPASLYGAWPLAGGLPPLGWPLDLNSNAAKLQLAQFQVQAQAQAHAQQSSQVAATTESTTETPTAPKIETPATPAPVPTSTPTAPAAPSTSPIATPLPPPTNATTDSTTSPEPTPMAA